jgi:DNA polymerase III delta subunit
MQINLNQLDGYLVKSSIDANFLLVGDDFGQIIYITDMVIKKYFGNESYYIEYMNYSDLQKDSAQLKNSLQSLQLFSDKKAIVINGVGDNMKKDVLDLIKTKSNDFLLIIQGEKLRKSSKTHKELSTMTNLCIVNCYKLGMDAITVFVDKFLQSHLVKYSREVTALISKHLPDNVLLIKNELEKIVQYLGEEELTMDVVERVILGVKDFSYVNLCAALIFKDKMQLLEQIKRFDNEGVTAINLIRMLQNYFARVLLIKKEERFKGEKAAFIINNLTPPVFFKEKNTLLEVCNKVSYEEIIDLMTELVDIEIKCKVITFNTNTLLANYFTEKIQS